MATIKHLTSKNSNYAAAESYLTFQHNEYTGLPILDEKGRPKLRDSYLLDTLECGESSFAMACLIANRKYGKNGTDNSYIGSQRPLPQRPPPSVN